MWWMVPNWNCSSSTKWRWWHRRDLIGKPSVFCQPPTPGQIHPLSTPPDTCGLSRIGQASLDWSLIGPTGLMLKFNWWLNIKLPPMTGSMTSHETVCQIRPSPPSLCFACLCTRALTWPGEKIYLRLLKLVIPDLLLFLLQPSTNLPWYSCLSITLSEIPK